MVNKILAPAPSALAHDTVAEPVVRHKPVGFSDRFALGFTKLLRLAADTFFAKRYGHRAIVLETVAAVPGTVVVPMRLLISFPPSALVHLPPR